MAGTKGRRAAFTPAQVLAAGFALMILIGTVLLALPVSQSPGQRLSLVDALFMATSAVCVTGLTVVDVATAFSTFGEVVIMLLMQAGGLGIMGLSTLMFLATGRRIGLQERLMMQEALGSFSIAGVVKLTRNIIATTLAVEAVGAAVLSLRFLSYYPAGKALYFGVFHSISAFNNAGFTLTPGSLHGFNRDPLVLVVIGGLCLLGGMGYLALQDVWRYRRWERFSLQTKIVLVMTGGLLAVGTLLILAMEYGNPATLGPMPFWHKLVNALFTAVSIRAAGFESVSLGQMAYAALPLAVVMMYIGGSPAGTGGGIKTTTFAVIALAVRATVRGTEEIQAMGRRMPRDLLDRAIAIAAMAMATIVVVSGLLLVTEHRLVADPGNPASVAGVLFEGASAFTTAGLTTGITPDLSLPGRLLVIFAMYIGRIGPLTAAVALAERRRERAHIEYPEERVMIG